MDPTLKARITGHLLEEIPNYSKALSRAAIYVLDHPAEFGVHSIRESAARIGVSTNTLVRLSAVLGFDSFQALRAPFQEALLVSDIAAEDVSWLRRLDQTGGLASVQAEASASAIGNVSRTLRDLDSTALDNVVRILFDAERVFIVGMRVAYSLAYYFHYVARMALPNISLVPRQMNPAIDDLTFAGPSDVLFAVTAYPYSVETIRTCAYAREEKKMRLVVLSDSLVPAPELRPDEILVASSVSTYHFSSYIGMMSVMETLLAAIVAHGGPEARARIASCENLREQTYAYWEPSE